MFSIPFLPGAGLAVDTFSNQVELSGQQTNQYSCRTRNEVDETATFCCIGGKSDRKVRLPVDLQVYSYRINPFPYI